ncbi:MAG: hypothetical protein ACRENH_15010, partial [Gemmatimonadaceae bacterium]
CVPALLAAQSTMPPGWPSGRAKLRFEISIAPSVRSEETTGRVYVILSRTEQPEPRLQIGRIGVPMFARDVDRVAAGRPVMIDGSDLGHPVWDLADIPRGEYWVQAFVNVYSEFRRADGHVVWMHDDQWEGQHWNTSPNNLYSTARRLTIDPARAEVVRLTVDQKIPHIALAANT